MSAMSNDQATVPKIGSRTDSDSRQNKITDAAMSRAVKPIYLVVATSLSPPLGIGLRGTLPWPQIRSDMAFFRRVTSGTSPSSTTPSTTAASTPKNAVIMGRKTWDSIPSKFRPLTGRLNVVLTKSDTVGLDEMARKILIELKWENSGSLSIVEYAGKGNSTGLGIGIKKTKADGIDVLVTNSLGLATDLDGHDIQCRGLFCIGGAEIYKMMLQDAELKERVRILQTEVKKVDGSSFECDTFFPEDMEKSDQWDKISKDELKDWAETDLPQGDEEWAKDEKAGVEVKVVGWKRVSS